MTTAILICGDGVGCDATFPDARAVVGELCRHPEAMVDHVWSGDGLVLVLHPVTWVCPHLALKQVCTSEACHSYLLGRDYGL